jgi:hypothetical protein
VQTCLNQRVIKHTVFFAAGHKGEASEIGEHRSGAVLPIKAQKRVFLWELVGSQIPTNGGERLAQFLSIATVPAIAKTAEPLIAVSLADDGPRPDDLSPLAPGAQTSSNRRKAAGRSSPFGKARWRAASRVPSMSMTTQVFPARSIRPPVCFSFEALVKGRLSRSSRNSVRRASTGASVNAAKNRENAVREGNRSRSNNAMNGTAKG